MNIFSRRESYSFLAWKRNNWRLSKASTSESVNQNFRLARLFVLYTKDMQSNCCTKEGFDSFCGGGGGGGGTWYDIWLF